MSLLLLAAGGRLVTGNGAVCSVTRVPSRRAGWLCLVAVGALAVSSGVILSALPAGLSPAGHLLALGAVMLVVLWAVVAMARGFAQSRVWAVRHGPVFEVTNLAAAVPGEGFGGRLLDDVIAAADRVGARLVLRVRLANEPAFGLYRSRGFRESTLHVAGSDEVAMERARAAPAARPRSHPWLATPTVIVAFAMLLAGHRPFVVAALAAALAWLTAAAVVDRRIGRLPNSMLALAAVFAVVACDAADTGGGPVAWAVLAAASPLLLLHLLDPSALGFGDVKFGAVAGAAVAMVAWQVAVLVPLTALVVAAMRRPQGPRAFGPTMLASTAIVLVLAVVLSSWEVIT